MQSVDEMKGKLQIVQGAVPDLETIPLDSVAKSNQVSNLCFTHLYVNYRQNLGFLKIMMFILQTS
jgi:hypothetical protein